MNIYVSFVYYDPFRMLLYVLCLYFTFLVKYCVLYNRSSNFRLTHLIIRVFRIQGKKGHVISLFPNRFVSAIVYIHKLYNYTSNLSPLHPSQSPPIIILKLNFTSLVVALGPPPILYITCYI